MVTGHARIVRLVGLPALAVLIAMALSGCERPPEPGQVEVESGAEPGEMDTDPADTPPVDAPETALDPADGPEGDAGAADDDPADAPEGDAEQAEGGNDEATGEIISVSESTFEEKVLNADVPVLVDFTAQWCPPCKIIHPYLEEIAADYAGRAIVAQVNVDNNQALAQEFNVTGIPSLFVIKDGEIVDSVVGLREKPVLEKMLDAHIQ